MNSPAQCMRCGDAFLMPDWSAWRLCDTCLGILTDDESEEPAP